MTKGLRQMPTKIKNKKMKSRNKVKNPLSLKFNEGSSLRKLVSIIKLATKRILIKIKKKFVFNFLKTGITLNK